MSDFFDPLEERCQQYKEQYACIKKYNIEGYAGSFVRINVVFSIDEHVYLAEKMAGKDFLDSLDVIQKFMKRLAIRTSGKLIGHNISLRCEFV